MKKNFTIIPLIAIMFFTGCQSTQNQAYLSDLYSFEYPNNYTVEQSNEEGEVLIVEGEKGRVEIFNKSDFADYPGGERIHGYSSSGEEEFEWRFVPKEKIKSGDYEMWLFYEENDEQTKKEVQAVCNSFRIK